MKRLVLLFLLSILAISSSASAQTGWMRMPDGPWENVYGLYFHDEAVGYVESPNKSLGSNFYITTDAGLSWAEIDRLEGWESACIRSSNLESTSFLILGKEHLDNRLYLTGLQRRSHCSGSQLYTGMIWIADLAAGTWLEHSFTNSRLSTFSRTDDGTLFAYAEDYMFTDDRGRPLVLQSLDEGNTWIQIKYPGPEPIKRAVARFANKDSGYVWTDYFVQGLGLGFYTHWTSDGGLNWRSDTVLPAGGWSHLPNPPYYSTDGRWYRGKDTELEVTNDLGRTWRTTADKPFVKPIKPDDSYYSQFAGYNITNLDSAFSLIAWREDSGGMWNEMQAVEGYLNEISGPSERVAYAVGPNGLLYKTTDGGGRFASVSSVDKETTKLKALSSGNAIIVQNAGSEIRVMDILGRVVRTSIDERLDGFAPGVYFVVSGEESVRVLVSPM